MTITKITFQQTFPTGPYMNQKLGIEIELLPTDSIQGVFIHAKETIRECFEAMNPSLSPEPINHSSQQVPVIDKGKERVEILIDNATCFQELVDQWENAKKYGLEDHYKKKQDYLQHHTS